jgi:hypothetical protein
MLASLFDYEGKKLVNPVPPPPSWSSPSHKKERR